MPPAPFPPGPLGLRRPRADLSRSIVPALLGAMLLALLVLSPTASLPARAEPPRSVTVLDRTGTVDEDSLSDGLEAVDLRADVDLVALVVDVEALGGSAEDRDALDDAVGTVLDEDLQEHKGFTGSGLAEGTAILAVDPEHRYIGLYAADDVELGAREVRSVHEAMRGPAREGRTEEALVEGAREYARLLAPPWRRTPGGVLTAVALLAAVGAGGTWAWRRRARARARADAALPLLQQVLAERQRTESAARRLPEASAYAHVARAAHADYRRAQEEADRLRSQVLTGSSRSATWGFLPGQQRDAESLERAARELEHKGEEVRTISVLLRRDRGWEDAWEQELVPLHDSLEALAEDAFTSTAMPAGEKRIAEGLVARGPVLAEELAQLDAEVRSGTTSTDAALKQLDARTRELSEQIDELRAARVSRLAADRDEEELLLDAAEALEDVPCPSVRAWRHRWEVEARGGDVHFWSISPMRWYVRWQQLSLAELQGRRHEQAERAARSSSSSSSSSSGGIGRGHRSRLSPSRRSGRSVSSSSGRSSRF